jgi:hypothetical protein
MVSLSGPPDGGTKFGFIITEKARVKGGGRYKVSVQKRQ